MPISNEMKKITYLITFLIIFSKFNAQVIVSQDYFNGEVIGFGYSPWLNNNTDTLYFSLQSNSTIKKVQLLFTTYDSVQDQVISINSNSLNISASDKISSTEFMMSTGFGNIYNLSSNLIDITDLLMPNDTSIIINTPYTNILNGAFTHFYFIIFAENINLPVVNSAIIVNNQDTDSILNYNITNLNSIDTSFPMGLALNSSHHCTTINDGSYIYVNNDSIGLIKGEDYNSTGTCDGTRGDFQYHSNTLFSLGDDTANNLMNGVDALANVQYYINDLNSLELKIVYEGKDNPFNPYSIYTNPFFQFFLTYSTPCDTFTVDVPKEINVCRGETALINVSGGNSYEWLPQVGLSCYNCANPVFNGDSTMYYTVRIWNNDSCSKVMPVHVVIQENPIIPDYIVEGSDCVPNNTGHVYATFIPQPSVFSIDGGTNQSTT
ncbi:MAG: hypothetical protein ACI8Q1_003028, partial [Parvicella sp.]